MSNDNKYYLQKAEIVEDRLIFNNDRGFEKALEDGFFLVRIPDEVDLTAADTFAKNFYKPKSNFDDPSRQFKGFSAMTHDVFGDPLLGFHKRKYQIEQFLLERRFWQEHYPSEVAVIGEALCKISTTIIKSVLAKVNIPHQFWDKASGGCSNGQGSYHLTFNHFRPEMDTLGLQEHRDDGFITILRSTEPGLEIFKDGEWLQLSAEPAYFKINFGLTMQILTKELDVPVAAVLHKVTQQAVAKRAEDRWSWGHFSSCRFGTDYDTGIYIYEKTQQLKFYAKSREHINRNDNEIYK